VGRLEVKLRLKIIMDTSAGTKERFGQNERRLIDFM
jgi:hypothetical protein